MNKEIRSIIGAYFLFGSTIGLSFILFKIFIPASIWGSPNFDDMASGAAYVLCPVSCGVSLVLTWLLQMFLKHIPTDENEITTKD